MPFNAKHEALRRALRIKSGKGSLYLWMRENYQAIAAEFATVRPRWEERVKVFAKAGLLDERGKPPTVKTAQNTWYRVAQEMAQPAPHAERVRPTGFRAKPFEMPSRLVDWTEADVSRETNHDEIAATNPAGEKI